MSANRPHRRLFTVLMWCIPAMFFVLLEVGLRLVGFGDDYPLFVPVPEALDYQVMNREVARRYFRREARVPTGLHDVFLARKDTNVVRIVVQGGSSAAGYPYYYGGSFSRMLEQRLQQSWPERHIEVVNTAVAAVNSYAMLDLADAILAIGPDAVVIYAGHNEYYGALGVGSSESIGQSRFVIRLYLKLHSWRTMQLLQSAMGRMARNADAPSVGSTTLMERMVGRQTIPYQSKVYEAGLRQWQHNLRALLRMYRRHDIPVLVGTVASNERTHAPFISASAVNFEPLYQEAMNAGDLSGAIEVMQGVVGLDSTSAQPFFLLAQLLDAKGEHAQAREAYIQAKDRDQLRFRAPEAINAITRVEAEAGGARLVDTQLALVRSAHDGIIGSDLMLEHLHPNVEGYFLIADAFYEALMADSLLGRPSRYVETRVARREVLFTVVDSLFGAYRVRQLLSAWPFRPLGTPMDPLDTLVAESPVEAIALELFRGEVQWYEATDRLRIHYEQQQDYHRALQASLAMIQQYPYLPRPYAQAADLMARQGRVDDALVYFEAANDIEEIAAVHYMLGILKMRSGRVVAAKSNLERAAELDPTNVIMRLQLSQYYVLVREREQAAASVAKLLELDPEHEAGNELQRYLASGR
ncbi:MAG: hypothetical protein OXM02_06040 [Bacteroidota bacterium]|nr:hypothetical protein [Bacteroidota bacterium]